jgi:arylsulfatase
MTAMIYDWNMLPIGQQLWYKHLLTFREFPPMQIAESYNLEQVLKQIEASASRAPTD